MPNDTWLRLQYLLDELIVAMDWLKAADHSAEHETRIAVFNTLKDVYCEYCGSRQPQSGKKCQCWNDE